MRSQSELEAPLVARGPALLAVHPEHPLVQRGSLYTQLQREVAEAVASGASLSAIEETIIDRTALDEGPGSRSARLSPRARGVGRR